MMFSACTNSIQGNDVRIVADNDGHFVHEVLETKKSEHHDVYEKVSCNALVPTGSSNINKEEEEKNNFNYVLGENLAYKAVPKNSNLNPCNNLAMFILTIIQTHFLNSLPNKSSFEIKPEVLNFNDLDKYTIDKILSFLSPEDLCKLKLVSKQLRKCTDNKDIYLLDRNLSLSGLDKLSLKTIFLNNVNLTDMQVLWLLAIIPPEKLEILDISNNPEITEQSFIFIFESNKTTKLKYLIAYNTIAIKRGRNRYEWKHTTDLFGFRFTNPFKGKGVKLIPNVIPSTNETSLVLYNENIFHNTNETSLVLYNENIFHNDIEFLDFSRSKLREKAITSKVGFNNLIQGVSTEEEVHNYDRRINRLLDEAFALLSMCSIF